MAEARSGTTPSSVQASRSFSMKCQSCSSYTSAVLVCVYMHTPLHDSWILTESTSHIVSCLGMSALIPHQRQPISSKKWTGAGLFEPQTGDIQTIVLLRVANFHELLTFQIIPCALAVSSLNAKLRFQSPFMLTWYSAKLSKGNWIKLNWIELNWKIAACNSAFVTLNNFVEAEMCFALRSLNHPLKSLQNRLLTLWEI